MIRAALIAFCLLCGAAPAWAQEAPPDAPPQAPQEAPPQTPQQAPAGPAGAPPAEVAEEAFEGEALPPLDPEWESLSERAVEAVLAARASTPALVGLRGELAAWRETFLAAEDVNSRRIRTVQSQLEALGEAPADVTENPEIAALREQLTERLAELRAPSARAAAARAEAAGLIAEIDAIIRDRQAEQFMDRDRSPLDPQGWLPAWQALTSSLRAIEAEIVTAIESPAQWARATSNLPGAIALAVLGVVLMLRWRRWIAWLEGQVHTRSTRGREVWTFLVSLGRLILPFAGLAALSGAVQLTGLAGRRLSGLLTLLPFLGLIPIVAHWLAGHLLWRDPNIPDRSRLGLTATALARVHGRFVRLGYLVMLVLIVEVYLEISAIEGSAAAVILFPFGLAVAMTLYRIGRSILYGRVEPETGPDGEEVPRGFRDTLLALVGRLLIVDAVLGVGLAVLGFVSAFDMIVAPAAGTLYLLGVLILLQRLVFDLYGMISGSDESTGDSGLIPVVIAFLLALAAMPVLALIWGARVTDLTELWARFQAGFDIGGTVISPGNFLTFVIVFVIGFTVVRLLQGALRSSILPRTRMDIGGQNAINAGVGYLGILLAAVIAITTAGINLSGLAIVAGALSVGIGFGLQNIVSNFVSGIILLIERPISEGDWIEVGGQMGYVRDISVRSTRIETFDRTDVIIPNADLVSGTVTNYTRGNSVGRLILPVGVAYGTDTRKVEAVLKEVAEAHPMVLLNPAPMIHFAGFGDSSLDFEIRAILRDVNWVLNVKTEMNHEIARRFAEEGIEIPFPQRDVWLRRADTARPPPAARTDAREMSVRRDEDIDDIEPPAEDTAPPAEDTEPSWEGGS